MKIIIQMFPMIEKKLMGLIKLRHDVHSGTTEGWVCLVINCLMTLIQDGKHFIIANACYN
jgi:hypothetical protein